MEDLVYQRISKIEEQHWWFSSRRDIIKLLLQKSLDSNRKNLILDIGCGTGNISTMLNGLGEPVGIDISEYALDFCKRKNLSRLCRATTIDLPFKDNSFDAIVCAGVLYHKMVRDDKMALGEMFRVCRKGGVVLLLEPAFEWLRSPHDIVEHTGHRYTLGELSSKVKKSGFKIKRASYHMFFLFPMVLIIKVLKKIFVSKQHQTDKCRQTDLYSLSNPIDKILAFIVKFENRILSYMDFPFGTTAVCLAVK